jgi:hypothetical protein
MYFKDFFSKLALDILALHCTYNLKIELEKDAVANLRFSPLQHYTLEELKAYK